MTDLTDGADETVFEESNEFADEGRVGRSDLCGTPKETSKNLKGSSL